MRTSTLLAAIGLALGICTTSVSTATAQSVFYVPAPAAEARFPAGSHYVAHVVDARPQHSSLGLVMRASAPQLATFQDGLLATLHTFFTEYAPKQPGATPLVMRLTGLEIAEIPGGLLQAATAGLVADFYAPQPDSSYQLVAHCAQVHTREALDATGQHAANLGFLLLEAAKLADASATGPATGPHYSRAAVLSSQPLAEDLLPLLAPAMQPRPGFYYSVTEFWHNQPSEPCQPEVERHPYTTTEWSGIDEVKPYHLTKAGRYTLATDVWGFCDGTHFYIRRRRSFYELTRRGANFVYSGQLDDDPAFRKASNSRTATNALVMGWAGAAATATSGERRALFTLNLLTDKSSLDQTSSVATSIVGRPTHLFIYRPRDAKGPAVHIRLADDLPAQALAAGDFLTFEPTSEQPLRVCLLPAAGPETYLAVTPTSEAPTYLECRPADSEPLRKVKDSTGAAALTKLLK